MEIKFNIDYDENSTINVKVGDLLALTSNIASFCQGAQAASWTDTIVDEVMAYLWFGIESPYKSPYISADWTNEELTELLSSIKSDSEKLGWYVVNDESCGFSYIPLSEAIENFKLEKHFKV